MCEEFTGWNHDQKAVWSWSEYDWRFQEKTHVQDQILKEWESG